MLLDIFIVLMLFISIIYSLRLNKKIKEFNATKVELAELIKSLDYTVIRAETNIEVLKELSINLSSKVDTGKVLSDDLSFMIDRAGILADKLEGMITLARDMEKNSLLASNTLRSRTIVEPNINKKGEEIVVQEQTRKATIESLLSRISNVKYYYKKEKAEV
ncbi:hypothetical protein NOVO_01445 [Rickettsiales bacterium Ac37b]|nr:hypothetical protein NOVO_01445 [Rickettsiales bacterium Ac37b]